MRGLTVISKLMPMAQFGENGFPLTSYLAVR